MLLSSEFALQAAGGLDLSFNGTGMQTTAIGGTLYGGGYDAASGVVVQTDGKIVVAAQTNDDGSRLFVLLRYNTDGSLDTSFNGTGRVTTDFGVGGDNIPYGMALQTDGRIIVVGEAGGHLAAARYTASGSLDTTFNGTGKAVITDTPCKSGRSVAVQTDGKIVVATEYTDGSNHHWICVVRFKADGTLDTDFGSDAPGRSRISTTAGLSGSYWFDSYSRSVALQADGKIVLAGYGVVQFQSGTTYDIEVTRFNSDGTWDFPFGIVRTDFGNSNDLGSSVAVQGDGKIVVAGQTNGNFALVRYNTNGTLDTTLNGTGSVAVDFGGSDDSAGALALQSDGKMVLAGWTNNGGGYDFALARLASNGGLDTGFYGTGKLSTAIGTGNDLGSSLALQSDGAILVAGSATISGSIDVALARYLNPAPEITVEQPSGTSITDGGSTDFGGMAAGASGALTFKIWNTGTGDLTGLAVTKNGTNAADFNVNTTGTNTSLTPNAFTTFTVTFAPGATGARSAAIHIASNDSDENPFDVLLSGTGLTQGEYWRQSWFGSSANSGAAADTSMPQNDGLTNLMKFAMGIDPTRPGTAPLTLAGGTGVMTFIYTRSKAAVSDGVAFTVEWSETLAPLSWNSTNVSLVGVVDQGDTERVTVNVPAGTTGRRFVRLNVVRR
jgi:uncharacterized delta-60 repeat protein